MRLDPPPAPRAPRPATLLLTPLPRGPQVFPRNVTEFSYRFVRSEETARIMMSFQVQYLGTRRLVPYLSSAATSLTTAGAHRPPERRIMLR